MNKKIFTMNLKDLQQEMENIFGKKIDQQSLLDLAQFLDNADGIKGVILEHLNEFGQNFLK